MKFYCGIPAKDGKPAAAVVIDGGVRSLGDGLTWNGKLDPKCGLLAKAILLDAMGQAGLRYATRFRWRMDPDWQPGKYWRLDADAVARICADIDKTWDESGPMRARVSREPRPMESETGMGVGGRKIEISPKDQADQFQPNDPKKARYLK